MKTIFENHGGCEKSFIYLDLINKDIDKKYTEFLKLAQKENLKYLI